MKDSLLVIPWDAVEEDTNVQSIKNGTYQIWQPEKTLFESDEIQSNWGNLKKAAKMAGVSDDTKIVLSDLSFGGYFSPFSTHEAAFRLKSFPGSDEKVIVVC